MSGLLSGLLLRRAGWAVDVYERVESELSGRGAGIVAQAARIERLRALGLPTAELGVHITTRTMLDARGHFTHSGRCPQVLTAWERVYRLLRDAFPPAHYHRGRGLARFTQDATKVTAHFSDGESIAADLLVGADGIRSTVRQQCAPDVAPLYAGYSAWRALIAESAFPPDVHRDLFDRNYAFAEKLLDSGLILPALEHCLKCSHLFNILDSSGSIGVTERTAYILRVRQLAVRIARTYADQTAGASADVPGTQTVETVP